MKVKLCIFFAALMACPAQAQNWESVSESDHTISFVDTESISYEKSAWGTFKLSWIRRSYKEPKNDGTIYAIAKQYYKCDSKSSALMEIVTYDKNDRVINFYTWDIPDFSSAPPGSVGRSIANFVCSR